MASAATGYTLHVIAPTTEPGTYSFSVGGFTSPTGRTAPIDPSATEFRIAAASCQHYETGFYAAHRDIADWAPDLVVFLGDFMYEGDRRELGEQGRAPARRARADRPRRIPHPVRHLPLGPAAPGQPSRRAVARSIWDDHEVENDYAGVISENDDDPEVFAVAPGAGVPGLVGEHADSSRATVRAGRARRSRM